VPGHGHKLLLLLLLYTRFKQRLRWACVSYWLPYHGAPTPPPPPWHSCTQVGGGRTARSGSSVPHRARLQLPLYPPVSAFCITRSPWLDILSSFFRRF
jgi:hypothetical protein